MDVSSAVFVDYAWKKEEIEPKCYDEQSEDKFLQRFRDGEVFLCLGPGEILLLQMQFKPLFSTCAAALYIESCKRTRSKVLVVHLEGYTSCGRLLVQDIFGRR